jgi:hypothetical protein
MEDDEGLFERALGRIAKAMFAIGAGGAIVATAWRGWEWGAGFALGATASWLNFRWLKQFVVALGSKRPTRKRVLALAGLRYLLLGGGLYVILHYSRISLQAALAGLFVAAGAVIIEIVIQLVYART